ncbi:MAG: alpha-amylase family glycosyl hydrolase [Bacteroidales bacterium]
MRKIPFILLLVVAAVTLINCTSVQTETEDNKKIVIYQVFTRLFGSDAENPIIDGYSDTNGIGKFDDFTTTALDSIKAMGMTHIWYTGAIEHASAYSIDTVGGMQMNHQGVIKGKAGSPYAIKDYYDVNAYMANDVDNRMGEFEALIARSHAAGLKVLIDFVPNHVARGYHSDSAPAGVIDLGAEDDNRVTFDVNNNFYYLPGDSLKPQFDTTHNGVKYEEYPAKVTGNNSFSAEPQVGDWYETVKINYGVDITNNNQTHFETIPNTWVKMKDILLFWAEKGVDGFRCDMAEMVPKEFWGWVIPQIKEQYPDMVFIAEIYNPNAYEEYIREGGFDYLYDKVGLYDTLKSVIQGKSAVKAITESRKKIAPVQSHMLNFLENHDEQRIAWREFAGSAQAGIPMMVISTFSDNIPMMIYFGQEIGVEAPEVTGFSGADGRTTIFDFWSMADYQAWRNGGKFDGANLTADQQELRNQYIQILKMANAEVVFTDGTFLDLTEANPEASNTIYTFIRYTDGEAIIVAANLSAEAATASYTIPEGVITEAMVSETLMGETTKIETDNKINISLPAYGISIIKMK